MSNTDELDKILKVFGDYGYHDSSYGDCMTCKKVAEAKQAILNQIDKAIGEDEPIMSGGSIGSLQREARNRLRAELRQQLGIKAGENE